MAPRNPNPQDPNRIDVSLDLVGEGALSAIDQLTEAVRGLQAFTAEQGMAGSAEQRAAAAQAQARAGSRATPRMPAHEQSSHASTPSQAPGVQDAHGQGGSYPDAQLLHEGTASPWRRLTGYVGGRDPITGTPAPRRRSPISALDREIEIYGAREREQDYRRDLQGMRGSFSRPSTHAGTAYDHDAALFGGRGGGARIPPSDGGPSAGASEPPDGFIAEPTWMRSLRANPAEWERSQEAFDLPQFGELTIQDKLRMASDFFSRSAAKSYQRASDHRLGELRDAGVTDPEDIRIGMEDIRLGTGLQRGRAAMALRMGADASAQAVTAMREMRRFGDWGSGMFQQGVQGGFDRGGTINIPGTNIGVLNPFSAFNKNSAFREALNQRVNVQRLRLMGGIDGRQANEIVGSLASLGWVGEQGQNAAFDAVAPLVQQGLDAGITSQQMDQAVRNGAASFRDFREVLNDLGPSARAARMSLDEYQQSLSGFAEWAQSAGATNIQGLALGRQLSDQWGMAPQQIQQFAESPFTQSSAMLRFRALPNEIGALGSAALGGSISGAIDMAMRATSAFRNMPMTDPRTGRTLTDAQGRPITGERRQEIQAAQLLKVSPESFRRAREAQKIAPRVAAAQAALRDFNQNRQAGDEAIGRREPRRQGTIEAIGNAGRDPNADPHDDFVAHLSDRRDDASGKITRQTRTDLLNQQWKSVEQQLRALTPEPGEGKQKWINQINDLRDEDPETRAKKAHSMLTDRVRKYVDDRTNENTVQVKFTGAAEKWLQQQGKSIPKDLRDSNAGGRPRNESTILGGQGTDYNDYLDLYTATFGTP